MHKTVRESLDFIRELREIKFDTSKAEVVVCPNFTALHEAGQALAGSGIGLGAQNMHWEKQGAYTGEVSPAMLQDAGCRYVIIGHSERRQYFAETDQGVNHKAKAALQQGLTPILCVGETLEEREAGQTEAVVGRQVKGGLEGLESGQVTQLVIAYEPVWAIGTGRTASAQDANGVCAFIRRTVAGIFGQDSAAKVRIQYGGSVKADNIAELMDQPDIDGALVGGASLDAAAFAKIINYR